MRLQSIKLAGFKSFVDPTTVGLPSNLTAVVGPNGCGKSNVIDAVRWVMGESSAKYLRGESITDVIFNGSTGRQPIGQASVELIFDNRDATLGGEYAQYSEISIKRLVTRDAQSIYFLNNTRCRRRDILDIFLGTGLGPRSYAIIEQGTISRLIEAKPEELRVYLEEAAGISKYKERRRETELRIGHTRDNLARLTDLREELGKQLERLERQAETAAKYKVLKEEERLLKGQLWALRSESLTSQLTEQTTLIRELEIKVEALMAEQRHTDAELEQQRQQQMEFQEEFNEVQTRYYQLGAEIARLEQTLQHQRERRKQLEQDLEQAQQSLDDLIQHATQEQQQILTEQALLAQLEPELAEAEANHAAAQEQLAGAEDALQAWQKQWDEFNKSSAEVSQEASVQQTRIQHLEQRLQTTQQRTAKLEEEQGQLNFSEQEQRIAELQAQITELTAQYEQCQSDLTHLLEQIKNQRFSNQESQVDLDKARNHLQTLHGRKASLEALQQAALGQRNNDIVEWLKQKQLNDNPRLAQRIKAAAGWDRAVETVLGMYLEAVCVDNITSVANALESLTKGQLTCFMTSQTSTTMANARYTTLASKIESDQALESLLNGVYVADSITDAMQMLPSLAASESVITADGIWLGSNWLRVSRDRDERAGVLQRERELTELNNDIDAATADVELKQQLLEEGGEQLLLLEEQREQMQKQVSELARQQSDINAQLRIEQSKVDQAKQRQMRLNQEYQELTQQSQDDQTQLQQTRHLWQEAMQAMDQLADKRDVLMLEKEQIQQQQQTMRQNAQATQALLHELNVRFRTTKVHLESLQQTDQRNQQQLLQLQTRCSDLSQNFAAMEEPIANTASELELLLSQRVTVEAEFTTMRQELSKYEHAIQTLEKNRHQAEQSMQVLRSQLEQYRLDQQTWNVRRQTMTDQIAELGFELTELVQNLPSEANETEWEIQLQKTTQRIERLGAINLAAIEEYSQQAERKNYLDAQDADLNQALATLEEAIRKIDRETRARFKETYDKVNECFQGLFPRIFGGGSASLELTGEDLLETGVAVMARPPGKKNSTIHLLSGGEKALTAIALVFSIFQLNPAPFCMLDEVDAPLDDANIGRFCTLVKEMSEKVQFVFISHNKLAMEMANQLIGVTMNEPGVSRLVSVDVEEAMAMADA